MSDLIRSPVVVATRVKTGKENRGKKHLRDSGIFVPDFVCLETKSKIYRFYDMLYGNKKSLKQREQDMILYNELVVYCNDAVSTVYWHLCIYILIM